MTPKKETAFNFEKSLDELTQLVEKMEQGNLPLEQSLQYYEQGIGLIRQAHEALKKAEQKVKLLTNTGEEILRDFNPETEQG